MFKHCLSISLNTEYSMEPFSKRYIKIDVTIIDYINL